MNEQQILRYLSGYIDGDGCFRANITTQKDGTVVYERSITVTSVKKEPIILFFEFFGGFTTEEKKGGNRRKTYTWSIKSKQCIEVAIAIQPFLVIKKNQCSIFIEYCNSIQFNFFKEVHKNVIDRRNNLILAIRKDIHEQDLVSKDFIEIIKTMKNTVVPSEEDFLYLSGLIDAEGCFRVSHRFRERTKSKIYNTSLEIGNTKASIAKWLIERFGGSICFIKGCRSRKNSCTWALHSKSLSPLIEKIFPFIINKNEVCKELMEFQKTILKNGGRRSSQSFKKEFEAICLQRDLIIDRIHKINKKGLKV